MNFLGRFKKINDFLKEMVRHFYILKIQNNPIRLNLHGILIHGQKTE